MEEMGGFEGEHSNLIGLCRNASKNFCPEVSAEEFKERWTKCQIEQEIAVRLTTDIDMINETKNR